jgi:CHAD domain-containing protein
MLGTTRIETAKPNWPATRLAKLALHDYLLSVMNLLQLAVENWEHDIEYVHQLRVATRRAGAALRVFKEFLPRARRRWMAKKLRRIRRHAGLARDLDVLARRLRHGHDRSENHAEPGKHTRLLSHVKSLRRRMQKPLSKDLRELKRKRFKAKVRRLVGKVGWRQAGPEEAVSAVASRSLQPLVFQFFSVSQEDLTDPCTLHRLRICGKRLRYGLELFSGGFDPAVRDKVFPVFIDLQRRLGDINDHVTAQALFQRCRNESAEEFERDRFEELAAAETREIRCATRTFNQWWTTKRVTDLSERFRMLLNL